MSKRMTAEGRRDDMAIDITPRNVGHIDGMIFIALGVCLAGVRAVPLLGRRLWGRV